MSPPWTVAWEGPPPTKSVAAALQAAGFRAGASPSALATVVCTATATAPPARLDPCAVPWLWLCTREVDHEARTAAILNGAYDVVCLAERAAVAQLVRRLEELAKAPALDVPNPATFVARSPASRLALAQIARAARTSMPVLLTGETGTGKEVSARLLHEWSARHGRQFVPINCAAIPDELMEAELFGYARGAFTGAIHRYDGQLVAAAGGTVFLDEIDDTPLETQVKLLRVLEDRVVSRLGENEWHTVDFRIVAATNRDLHALIATGDFGADLYERLAIVSISLPPLRARLEDLEALCDHFIARFYREEPTACERHRVEGIASSALAAMMAYGWPGNVRELRNVIFETLVYKPVGNEILLSDLPRRLLRKDAPAPSATSESEPQVSRAPALFDRAALTALFDAGTLNFRQTVSALEKALVGEALARAGGNVSRAARLLGPVGRGTSQDPSGTVRAMMRRLGLGEPA